MIGQPMAVGFSVAIDGGASSTDAAERAGVTRSRAAGWSRMSSMKACSGAPWSDGTSGNWKDHPGDPASTCGCNAPGRRRSLDDRLTRHRNNAASASRRSHEAVITSAGVLWSRHCEKCVE